MLYRRQREIVGINRGFVSRKIRVSFIFPSGNVGKLLLVQIWYPHKESDSEFLPSEFMLWPSP